MKKSRITPQNIIQFLKFAFIGVLNTAIDFAVLNGLIAIFTLGRQGRFYTIFKVISFIAAVLNSYLFNKFWVFKKAPIDQHAPSEDHSKKELLSFLTVSLIGLAINAIVSGVVFMGGHSLYPVVSSTVWANVGALSGTMIVLIFNFFGYKLFVFKK